ncbi:hypothetical protein T261_0293 [Streptomyces lydicus]|nr:hypothetical protein T261_0293 [Streptomyces lydicus]
MLGIARLRNRTLVGFLTKKRARQQDARDHLRHAPGKGTSS